MHIISRHILVILNHKYYSAYSWINPGLSTIHITPDVDLFYNNAYPKRPGRIQSHLEHITYAARQVKIYVAEPVGCIDKTGD